MSNIPTEAGSVWRLAWAPNGQRIATGQGDGSLRTWEELYAVRHQPPAFINAVDWSPDGMYLLTAAGNDEQGAKDHTARIWDGETGEEVLVFGGHTMSVWPGEWSPTGKRVVTAGNEGIVSIWDSATGDGLLPLAVPVGYGLSALWSPDGHHLTCLAVQ